MIEYKIGNDWDELLRMKMMEPPVQRMLFISTLSETPQHPDPIYPPYEDLFNALKTTPFENTKVVILGQDPYINPGQAHGYAFSVMPNQDIPPSLMNIFKELHDDVGCFIPDNGYLVPWAEQGVLLLNTTLTVERGKSNSHSKLGWSVLTDQIIKLLSDRPKPIVFMMWGRNAQTKFPLVDVNTHLVLLAAHPSPLAGGRFFGCRHFSKANEFLRKTYGTEIDWQIPNRRKKQ